MKLMLLVIAIMIWLFWNGYEPIGWVSVGFAVLIFLGFVFGGDE
jgi:hypothetical protein